MNTDVENFANYINYNNSNDKSNKNNSISKKRPRENGTITADKLLPDLKLASVKKLGEYGPDLMKIKGRELSKFVKSLKENMKRIVAKLRVDEKFKKQLPEFLRLFIIAEMSVSTDVLDEIHSIVIDDKTKTFQQCIDHIKTQITQTIEKEKKKLKSDEEIHIEFNFTKEDEPDELEEEEEPEELNEPEELYEPEESEEPDYESDSDAPSSDDEKEKPKNVNKSSESVDKETRKKEDKEFINEVFKNGDDDDEDILLKYYSSLPNEKRQDALKNIKEINNYLSDGRPIVFQIMELPLPLSQKNHILKNYVSLTASRHPDNKLKAWFDSLMTIPFGKYTGINLDSMKTESVITFINDLEVKMNEAVYGHSDAKRQIIQMMGQQIRNPKSKGNILGIYGCPGNGKSSLVKEGIARAMGKPFVFISLGGATDSSFLEGHSYTYEGSVYGRIVNGLITSKCMDPIIYFDELDKISKTHKGEEITNILVHLTDPVQNSHFRDKYFHGIDIDLSRATIIFSFNDPSNVNPILLDRITTVETKYLMLSQKIHIAKNYLLPEMMKDMGLNKYDVTINDETIRQIINSYTNEGGVRKLKSILYNICRELNLANLINNSIDNDKVVFPFEVKSKHLNTILKHKMEIQHDKIHPDDKPGVVNGLWANSLGQGGILGIETILVPASSALMVKATGRLGQVIKESTEVATSLAWSYLPSELKTKLSTEWKERPMGIHIHCPDGATPKDGPSAGAALTLALYSLLTGRNIKHDIAMTGEINLEGKVTAIGGLEEKLEGAKRAGVKMVLYPKENQKHIEKIKERNKSLISEDFTVVPIETFDEVMKLSLI